MSDTNEAWIFDLPPASLARRGGDPSVHAFVHDVATLVREVVQNANDQAIAQPSVLFRLHELRGESLDDLLDALAWPTLRVHLEAAAEQPERGAVLRAALDDLTETGRLWYLTIEDHGTVGLTGAEAEDDGHFTALCRDTLFSHKASSGAGGSYGLGKSLMWSFSGLSTVLFCSVLSDEQPGQRSPRLIGRAELPAHEMSADESDDPSWYSGQGWFGRIAGTKRGVRAESLWDAQASELAGRLRLSRDDASTGTSIGILGLRDPTRDEELDPAAFLRAVAAAACENFWPAMARLHEPLRIGFQGPDADAAMWLDAGSNPALRPFVRCLRLASTARSRLSQVGDVARVDVPFELPARRDDSRPAVTGHVTLLVTRVEPGEVGSERVAMFRGPGMVVRYWSPRRLSLGAEPFFAALLCGHARSAFLDDAEATDDDVETFLRAAEPPGHDAWQSTPALKARYKRGYRKAIDVMHKHVEQALARLVVDQPVAGRRGPDRLRRRFPVARTPTASVAGRRVSPFVFEDVTLAWAGQRWSFFGRIRLRDDLEGVPQRWRAELRLRPVADDGRPLAATVAIVDFSVDGATSELLDDEGTAVITSDATAVEFSGETAQVPEGEVELEVRGLAGPDTMG